MVMAESERVRPQRVVVDSLSEIQLLSQGSLRYRRQVLALKNFYLLHNATVLLLDDLSSGPDDLNLHSVAHAIIRLEQRAPNYGAPRRRLEVVKMRGARYRGGYHDYIMRKGGIEVFPRLVAHERASDVVADALERGVPGLDALAGGGLDRGTSTLIVGPSGSGKSSIALTYAMGALRRNEPVLLLNFDEARHVFRTRASGIGMDVSPFEASGLLRSEFVDPAELSPGEFAGRIRSAVEGGTRLVVIDSLSGYLNAMPKEQFLLLQMHELLTYLNQQGVVTIVVLAQSGMVGATSSPVDFTYLSDTVILLRFFEAAGHVRRAASVIKKRTGAHETTIRDFAISSAGIRVGAQLGEFQGVLTGVPTYRGGDGSLLKGPD